MRVLHDLSVPLGPATLVYPGDAPFHRAQEASIAEGDGYNLSSLRMSAHVGTHVDAPAHFLADGVTIDAIHPSRWLAHALVIDTGEAEMIGAAQLAGSALEDGMAVLFRTRNAPLLAAARFTSEFCALTPEAAQILIAARVGIVGIDYLSIERYDDPSFPIHTLLLSHDILIAENLNLFPVSAGRYTLVLAPLRIEDGDGAPARAFLLTD